MWLAWTGRKHDFDNFVTLQPFSVNRLPGLKPLAVVETILTFLCLVQPPLQARLSIFIVPFVPFCSRLVCTDALQQSSPHDSVPFDGGANDVTGECVSFGE